MGGQRAEEPPDFETYGMKFCLKFLNKVPDFLRLTDISVDRGRARSLNHALNSTIRMVLFQSLDGSAIVVRRPRAASLAVLSLTHLGIVVFAE
jgi:hypothetical protein